jgi:ATP-dependent exoDNAse (exonuclease V) beta subunit
MGDGDTTHDVVWWDPSALHLDVAPAFGLRREELISKDVPPEVVAEGTRLHDSWRDERAAALARGRTPWLVVSTMTEWAAGEAAGVGDGGPLADVPEAEVVTLAAAPGRPSGRRFGTLVHAALATVSLDAEPDERNALVATQGRIVGATPEEVDAAAAAVGAVLAHPLAQQARSAEQRLLCHRELPVTMLDGDLLLEGVADLAFEHDGVMTVVDFKTDRAEGEDLDRYARQVRTYAEAIRRATGKPVRPVLVQV